MEVERKELLIEGLNHPIYCTRIIGDKPGKNVWITTGLHGAEYLGVETGKRLALKLAETQICGTVTILHVINGTAFAGGIPRIVPEDGKNPNRMFPGNSAGTVTERLAAWLLKEVTENADFFIDMHCGDLLEDLTPLAFYPHNAGDEVKDYVEKVLANSGFPYAIGSMSTNGTHTNIAMHGVPGMITEYGCHGLWTEEEVDGYMDCIWRILAALEVTEMPADKKETRFLEPVQETYSEYYGYWYPASQAGVVLSKGDLIGHIEDAYGNELARFVADEEVILLYQHIGLGVNQGHFLYSVSPHR